MAAIQTILHPTDFSEPAQSALRLAQRLAHDHGARLILLHVVPRADIYGELGMTIPLPEVQKEVLEKRRTQLEELAAGTGAEWHVVEAVHVASESYEDALNERLRELQPGDPSMRVEYRLCEGESAGEIVHAAATSSCDLIVMGTHGRSGLDRLVMGSVAEAVLRRAVCPVLAVKAPAPTPTEGIVSPLTTTIL
jgi:nucleotide-binding universal stress UspA family protein